MNRLRLYILLCFSSIAVLAFGQDRSFSFDTLFTRHADLFDSVISHKEDYRLQILYTRIDRDKDNLPHLTTYSYDADKYYYYCASMIKLPACALALEKINNLAAYRLGMLDSLGIDSLACTSLSPENMMLGSPWSCTQQYIKEMLMISNNNAFNPVYDFLGQGYFQDRLHDIGLRSAVISNRFAGCDTGQNRFCAPVSFYDRTTHMLKYAQPCTINDRRQFYQGELDPLVGSGYLSGGQLINQPKDFRFVNYIALSDLHRFLTKVIFPGTQSAEEKLNLTRNDYQYLYKCMGIFPRESAYPKLDSIHYPDSYMKYFMGLDSTAHTMPDNIRIFNKVGQAYGFMTDCSYVVDTLNKVEFFLSCSMYVNADGILNDGIYEYEQTGFPFFHNLFNEIYTSELTRQRAYEPKIQLPDFRDTLLFKITKPLWIKIDTQSMPEIETILCGLADSMWQDRRLFINYDNPTADEIFYRNLVIAVRKKASLDYPFENLRKKDISIITSDDKQLRVFSWDKDSPKSNYALLQFSDSIGKIYLRKPADFKDNEILPKLTYTRIYQLQSKTGTIYLLLGNTNGSTAAAEYLQAYCFKNGKPEKIKVFSYNKSSYSDLLVEKRTGKEHIIYDARHRSISFPMNIKSAKKTKGKISTRVVKLRFDGQVFKQ